MKKIFITAALAVVFFCAVGYTVYTAQSKNEKLSGWALANVEALARDENSETPHLYKTTCTHTVYYYNSRGQVERTVTYSSPCCVDGSQACYI